MNPLRIEVRSIEIVTKSGTSNKGKPYHIREQHGLVSLPNGETRRVALSLEAEAAPLDPGFYEPAPTAFYVGKFDDLAISMRARHWQRAESAKLAKVG